MTPVRATVELIAGLCTRCIVVIEDGEFVPSHNSGLGEEVRRCRPSDDTDVAPCIESGRVIVVEGDDELLLCEQSMSKCNCSSEQDPFPTISFAEI
eukprot:gene9852-biopygen1618